MPLKKMTSFGILRPKKTHADAQTQTDDSIQLIVNLQVKQEQYYDIINVLGLYGSYNAI
jgi:hypothetical protein